MIILAISGSGRAGSTNTAMLNTVAKIARPNHDVIVFSGIAKLPVFSPDLELGPLPSRVQRFADMISASDGVIISSPEYVRSIPGGLKNAIDWLVSREEIIDKPIALMHASHGGHDMLDHLRLVLSTVSQKFSQDLFLHFQLRKLSQEEISQRLAEPENQQMILNFLQSLTEKHAL
jgi:chromate reductase, NAD(P)H dehydrogenase (quinone)